MLMGKAIAVVVFLIGFAATVWAILVGFEFVGLPSEREVAVFALVAFGGVLMGGVNLK